MSILIVDDNPDSLLPLRSLLENAGFSKLSTATSAEEAYQRLGIDRKDGGAGDVDLILMDIVMPKIDGITACRRIKAHRDLRDIPIIMLTALNATPDMEAAFDAGANDFVTKPVNPVELLVRLRSALALKREMDCRKGRERELLRVTRQLEEANQKLQRLSYIDGLTEIANRRTFDDRLSRAWRHAKRKGSPLSVIMIDIDFFKHYNDAYGHQSGDACLREVAARLQKTLQRPNDFVARYGGEEFAVLLPETDASGGCVVAESLRAAVEQLGLAHRQSPVAGCVTISLGVATVIPNGESSAEKLVAVADRALYQAKHTGRNRFEAAPAVELAARGETPDSGQPVPGPHRMTRSPAPAAKPD